jgi:glutamate transport system substrate-binding protein
MHIVATDGSRRWDRRAVMRILRLLAVVLALVVTGAVGIVVVLRAGPPSEQQLLERAGLLGKRELLIGIKDDQPGLDFRDPKTGQFVGFDVEIAYLVAGDLGFRRSEIRFMSIESEDRSKMQASTGDGRFVTVDLVIATYSITGEREGLDLVSFSAPYLYTEQSVVTRPDHATVHTLDDLRGRPVCTLATATSQGPMANAGIQVISKQQITECVGSLLRGEVDAIETDAAILAGFVAADPTHLRQHDIGMDRQEAYGVNTGGNEPLRTLVNLALYHSLHDPADQRWEDAFDRYLRPEQPANLPQQVAVDRQPEVPKPQVRLWPWERFG